MGTLTCADTQNGLTPFAYSLQFQQPHNFVITHLLALYAKPQSAARDEAIAAFIEEQGAAADAVSYDHTIVCAFYDHLPRVSRVS